jgi:hypothetical protein
VSENRLLRRILGLQGKEVTGDLTKFHDEKINNCSLQQVETGEKFNRYGRKDNAYKMLVIKPERMRSLTISRRIYGITSKYLLKIWGSKMWSVYQTIPHQVM